MLVTGSMLTHTHPTCWLWTSSSELCGRESIELSVSCGEMEPLVQMSSNIATHSNVHMMFTQTSITMKCVYEYTCDIPYTYMRHINTCFMRDERGRTREANKVKHNQQGKTTQHTQDSHFPKKSELSWVGLYMYICLFV